MTLGILEIVRDFLGGIGRIGNEREGAFPKTPVAQCERQYADQNHNEDVATGENSKHF